MPTIMIDAVLFDVDGVLVHPWRFRDLLTRKYGIAPATTAPFFRGTFESCVVGQADLLGVLPPFLGFDRLFDGLFFSSV